MLLDLVNRISSEKKVKKKIQTSNFKFSQGPPENVLRTSWGRPESTSQGRPLNVRLRRSLDVISVRPQDVRLGHPHDVGSSDWDVPGTVKQDLQGTSCGRWRGTSSGRPGDQYLPAVLGPKKLFHACLRKPHFFELVLKSK